MIAINEKGFLNLPKLHMIIKQKSPSFAKNLIPWTSHKLLNKGKSAILPLFNGLEVLSFASDKLELFAWNFSENSNLDDSGISVPVFPSITNLKHNISVTSKMVKKVITKLDSSKTSGADCVPVVVLKNYELELSYILAEIFNICLWKSLVLLIIGSSHWWSLYLRMLGKNYC